MNAFLSVEVINDENRISLPVSGNGSSNSLVDLSSEITGIGKQKISEIFIKIIIHCITFLLMKFNSFEQEVLILLEASLLIGLDMI